MKKRINSDTVSGLIIVVISIFFLSFTKKMPDGAAQFPKIMLSLLGVLGFILALRGLRAAIINKSDSKESLSFNSEKNPMIAIALIVIYAVLLKVVGFYISTAIYTIIFMLFFREKRIKIILLTVLGINIFIYLLFVVQLKVELPQGILNLFGGLV